MCRTDVVAAVHEGLAAILDTIATALAEEAGVPRSTVSIGPVDFGPAVDDG